MPRSNLITNMAIMCSFETDENGILLPVTPTQEQAQIDKIIAWWRQGFSCNQIARLVTATTGLGCSGMTITRVLARHMDGYGTIPQPSYTDAYIASQEEKKKYQAEQTITDAVDNSGLLP